MLLKSLFLSILATVVLVSTANTAHAQSWDEHVFLALQARGEGDFETAADHFHLAAEKKGEGAAQYLWDACIQYARAGRVDDAYAMLERAIAAGFVDTDRLLDKSRLAPMHADPRWPGIVDEIRRAEQALSQTLDHPEIRIELLQMWREDQALVGQGAAQAEIITRNSRRLDAIVASHGWPTVPRAGEDGAWAAWAIAQHSDDIAFQKRALMHIADAVAEGHVPPAHYGELHDRIHRELALKQTFGMATRARDGVTGFYPIADEARVDIRRKAMGMPPLAVFANISGFRYVRPTSEEGQRAQYEREAAARQIYQDALARLEAGDPDAAAEEMRRMLSLFEGPGDDALYEFTAMLAATAPGDPEIEQQALAWLELLIHREWQGRSRMLVDDRLATMRLNPGWPSLEQLLRSE